MRFVTDERFANIPKILETPFIKGDDDNYPPYRFEIEMIRNMKFDPDLQAKIVAGNK